MIPVDLVLTGISELATPTGSAPRSGADLGRLTVIPDAALACAGDRIVFDFAVAEGVAPEPMAEDGGVSDAAVDAIEQALAVEAARTDKVVDELTAKITGFFGDEGIELLECEQADCALFAFKRACDLDPRWSNPHVNMGATFADMGKRARALAAEYRPRPI